jgi:hypothetical protein
MCFDVSIPILIIWSTDGLLCLRSTTTSVWHIDAVGGRPPQQPKPGQIIVFDAPLRFSDGRTLGRFEVLANRRSGRTMIYRDPIAGGLYRIPNVKARDYRLMAPD